MSGGGRKRDSKWDLKEETRLSLENVRDNAWHGKAGVSFNDNRSPRWSSPEATGNNGHRWESLPGNRGGHDDDTSAWDGDGSYGTTMSPGLDDWREHRHHSPKNEWNRSRRIHSRSRSHSRSWSRSRSRSRSPVRGFRREAEVYDRNRSRSRSGVSAQLCKDYVVGRCRRGNHCYFLHQGNQNYEDGWESRDRKAGSSKYSVLPNSRDYPMRSGRSADFCIEFEKGSCRRGASCRFIHHGASIGYGKGSANEIIGEREKDTRNRDISLEQGSECEPRRSDIPCKFFAAGNCRNGKYCRFSHHGQTRRSPDRRPRDERWVQDHNSDKEKLWESPKWSDTDPISNARKLRNDQIGRMNVAAPEPQLTSYSKGEPTVDHKAVENEKEALMGNSENAVVNRDATDPRDTQKWLDDVEMSPGLNYGVEPSNNVVKEDHGHITPNSQSLRLNNTSVCTRNVGAAQEAGHIPDAAVKKQPTVIGELYLKRDHNMKDGTAMALPCADKNGVASTPPRLIDLNSSANTLPSFEHNSQGFSTAGLNQGAISNKPDIEYTNVSQANAGIPPTQNVVSSEQLTQLTNLSVSLAQLFGNGQQLPQLYATLNSQNAVDMPSIAKFEASVRPNFEVAVRPNEVIGAQKQYDPICDSIELGKHNVSGNHPGLPPNPVGQEIIAEGNPELTPKNVPSRAVTGVPNYDGHWSNKTEPSANCELTKVKSGGTVESKKEVEENSIAQVNGLLENLDGDEGKPDEGKKGKDVKGTRAFKFALVEFVKELLKPAWKEGQIGKEDYKNIVKKAVDKVTSTMQGAAIPQAKEKIDQYLSYSKPKLTKLVQAYVEKFQKGMKEA